MCAHCEHAQRDPSENLEHVVRPGGGHLTFAPSSLHQVASPREAVGEAGMQAVASVGGSRTGQGPGSCHQCDGEPAGVLLVTALQQPTTVSFPLLMRKGRPSAALAQALCGTRGGSGRRGGVASALA